jgi:hypothetical protein
MPLASREELRMARGSWWVSLERMLDGAWLGALIFAGCTAAGADDPSSPAAAGQPGVAGMAGLVPMQPGSPGAPIGMPGAGSVAVGAAGMVGLPATGAAGAAGGFVDPVGTAGMGAAGMVGVAGTDGMVAGTGGVEPMPMHADLGMGDGHDVVLVGDSWMNLGTVGIQQSVLQASGQPYRVYGVPGTRLLDEVIPNQYYAARAENPDIKTVIMTGGGNDILQNPLALIDCPALGETCKGIIDMTGARYVELAAEMAADGVEDLIVIGYSRNTLLGAAPVDYSYETIGPTCETAPLGCYTVDPDQVAGGLMELRDGIHPTDANYDLLGEHIVDLMVSAGIRR